MRSPRLGAVLGSLLCLLSTACAAPTADTGTAPSTPSAAPSPTLSPEIDLVDAALVELDRRGQVAQLIVVGVALADLSPADDFGAEGVGGVFLQGRSSIPADQLAAETARWAESAQGPRLWVGVDQEGGAVQTLSGPGFADLPSALLQGRMPAEELAALADDMGASLSSAGINLNLAPVADVVPSGTEDGNAAIGAWDRQYGSTAEDVVRAAGTIADGLAAHGVTPTLKHFPGLGRVPENPDKSRDATDDVTTRDDEQVAAFGALAGSDADPFVMMSSATYTQIDASTPAVFSPVVVNDLLRGQLGFDGVVISDDIGAAQAVQDTPIDERAVRFLEAGGTLMLTMDADAVDEMIDAVLARAESDPEFAATVDAAVRTALTAKADAGLLPDD
ncbi:glycoside hydrolase family 3 N-terminal domain-containing protein [Geodermatophilus obscurus]|uniref:Beta-N-acetylhexosaminidase n=1 Tax=Geodermatophilus obscurus (strain ATCC 25078 / DSM 43160 / JCM 3152 / CCUG 61914 / KCC A-0152 / KCTC 9177 / NBRC 13315 / NRRL B-3577 / G-20) TaxID=526225 RepID=D2S564_GEOOG|nr:glycoside hydrolase family 3 N-terminal domain-containing protein [Geodermatophilus obscurus]ADB73175.1 Beta-N-acetylhexosaminidase [Geodermatophilus obscurus DSM 43160]